MNRYHVCKESSLSLLCSEDGDAKQCCLDDDVINSYLYLLRVAAFKIQVHVEVFNTHFMDKIMNDGIESVDRWYQKADIFNAEQLLIPINDCRFHWTLMVVNFAEHKMMYYDSLNGSGSGGSRYYLLIKDYLSRQSELKKTGTIDWKKWDFVSVLGTPQQHNGYDCGAFVLQYACCIIQKAPMTFTQGDIPEIRCRIYKELKQDHIHFIRDNFNGLTQSECDVGKETATTEYELQTINDPTNSQPEPPQNNEPEPIEPKAADSKSLSPIEDDLVAAGDDKHSVNLQKGSVKTSHCYANKPLSWSDLPHFLQSVIPSDEEYSYIIEECNELPAEGFSGASNKFTATIRINLNNENESKDWLDKMCNHSKCTYRITRTYKPSLKRILWRADMHCQHYRKPLTTKQLAAKALSKKKSNPLMGELRQKKTKCPSSLTLKIQNPTKRELYSCHTNFCQSHKGHLQLNFTHNHPLHSAHVLSFRPVSAETKEKYDRLFSAGHSAASAHHYYENTLMDEFSDELQPTLADRAANPTIQDVNRLYQKWRSAAYGPMDNGPDLFTTLQAEVDEYNDKFNSEGGKALLQKYERWSVESSDDDSGDDFTSPPTTKRRKMDNGKPLILVACTPLMARAHEMIQQSGEMMFCDSTSCLEKYNCSLFILSTNSPAGGVPLAVAITSDEKQDTIKTAMEMVKQVLPERAFHGREEGPKVIMTDDSSSERNALSQVWPKATLLLCIFHFLQSCWTWLHDGNNKIKNHHRTELIAQVKQLVYAKSISEIDVVHNKFLKNEVVCRYPKFQSYIEKWWQKRMEWALCYRKSLLVRGNHTNNVAEAGIRILKEIVFGRIKAYNLVQMFQFVTDAMELYYKRRLLSIAHNRFDHYIAVKYKGLNAAIIPANKINKQSDSQRLFVVASKTDPGVYYTVDMDLCTCSCPQGMDGSPCIHQAAVVKHHHSVSFNFVPTLYPSVRREIAIVALGDKAENDLSFYSSLHQQNDEQVKAQNPSGTNPVTDDPDLSTSSWHLIRAGEQDETVEAQLSEITDQEKTSLLISNIDEVAEILKGAVTGDDHQLSRGTEKFIKRFTALSSFPSKARLASALHCFGTEHGVTTSVKSGSLRRGKQIKVQATATGRRKFGTKGRGPAQPGRPRNNKLATARKQASRYTLLVRRKNQVKQKRPHSLSTSIKLGRQNAGKW